MSYILDALNKAERERRLGQVPRPASAAPSGQRRRWLGLSLIVLLTTNLGWLGLRLWLPVYQTSPAVTRKQPHPAATAMMATTSPQTPSVVVASTPLASTKPKSYDQLSAQTRRKLGKLQLDITVFSKQPGQRFVVINDRRYRQGDWLRPGLLLEQISADGATLNYRGHRFMLRINP